MLLNTHTALGTPEALQAAAAQVMRIEDTTYGDGKEFVVRFRGRLVIDSVEAYSLAAEKFRALGCTPLFRWDGDAHAIIALRGTLLQGPMLPSWLVPVGGVALAAIVALIAIPRLTGGGSPGTAAVPSVDALFTTTTSRAMASRSLLSRRLWRSLPRLSERFRVAIMTLTLGPSPDGIAVTR